MSMNELSETIKIAVSETELAERLALNHRRMSESFYDIDNVFAPIDAKWPGDKEGRALLAFVSLVNAGESEKDEKGIYRDGDIIYAETVGDSEHGLHPLIKYYKLTEDEIMNTEQRIVFAD